MVIRRGDIWWADLDEPRGSEPGYRRPALVVQVDALNQSGLRTVIVVAITSNLHWKNAPGNVLIPPGVSGLQVDSVANVTQIITLDREFLLERIGAVDPVGMREVDRGLGRVLGLMI